MPSYKYNSRKFRYRADTGETFIRTHREYLDDSGAAFVPVTPIFLTAVVATDIKTQKFDGVLRRVDTEIPNAGTDTGYSAFKQFLPYPPGDANLVDHIKEINDAVSQRYSPYCIDYYGERRKY